MFNVSFFSAFARSRYASDSLHQSEWATDRKPNTINNHLYYLARPPLLLCFSNPHCQSISCPLASLHHKHCDGPTFQVSTLPSFPFPLTPSLPFPASDASCSWKKWRLKSRYAWGLSTSTVSCHSRHLVTAQATEDPYDRNVWASGSGERDRRAYSCSRDTGVTTDLLEVNSDFLSWSLCAQVKQDWQFVSMVVDRLMFWLFTAVSLVGTFGIIIQSPTLYDDREPIYTKNWPAVTSAMTSRGHLRVRACVRDFDVRCASSNAKSTVNASTRRQCSQVAEFWNVEVWLVQTGIADPVVPDHRYDVATSHFSDSTLLLARWPVGRLGLLPNKQRRDGANDRERKCADT